MATNEYAFSPAAQAVELSSGESREIVFQATRVAYRCYGCCHTFVGSAGRRCFGGSSFGVRNEEIRGLDIVVFEQPERTILSSYVEGQKIRELHSSLFVEVKSATDQSKVISIFPLPLSNFFQVKDLLKGKYLLRLRSEFPSTTHKFESEVIEVDLEKNSQIHVGPLRYKIEDAHHKQDLTVAPLFPLIVGVSVIVLFISMPRVSTHTSISASVKPEVIESGVLAA
ncbi:hypothetical protein CRG98_047102, partial [Punica granatum]